MSKFTMGDVVQHKVSGQKYVFQRMVHREEGERALCENEQGNLDYISPVDLEREGSSNLSIVDRLAALEMRVAELEKAVKNKHH